MSKKEEKIDLLRQEATLYHTLADTYQAFAEALHRYGNYLYQTADLEKEKLKHAGT